ncbi:hypothetical protein [Desulfovibrio oxyclinae]|jgi:hypothetical protein|uniref:hypothetical protein n=1 Tax=Desulfovibrio oxyclinae TaxID=63560 RepID=UPI000375A9FC|nr:hypothetical protein [Desulfovibrio oxyclinae]
MSDISLSNNSVQAMGYDSQIRPIELESTFMQAEGAEIDTARTKTDSPDVEVAPRNTGEHVDTTNDPNTRRLNAMFMETGVGSITERLA